MHLQSPSNFVEKHQLAPSDSLASLAVCFQTTPSDIKRLNSLGLSEACLASRTHVFLPGVFWAQGFAVLLSIACV